MSMSESEGSEYDRLFYPFLFEGGKSSIEDVLAQVRHSSLEKCREVIGLRRATLESSGPQIVAAAQVMARAFANGATLLAFGNGGSTTDAQDMVTELLSPPFPDWPPLPAIALTNDIAVVTAVGNDVGFDNVFARQVIAFGRRGDIAVGISTSGNIAGPPEGEHLPGDRKSTRLNSSHPSISYAVFCLKKKKKHLINRT